MKITFFFDYISPYSYLAWRNLHELVHTTNADIIYKPILFAGLLNHWGQKGPAEISPKRDYVFTHCLRYATKNNIEFTMPKFHPFNPLTCLRLSLQEVAGNNQTKVMKALWEGGWIYGRDLGDQREISRILLENDLPAELLMNEAEKTENKEKLKQNTEEAIELGVFGVPTFVTTDNTLFWGIDSMEDLKDFIFNRNLINPEKIAKMLATKSSATRKNS